MKFKVLFQLVLACSTLILLTVMVLAQVAPPPSVAIAPAESKASGSKRGFITGRVLGDDGQPLTDVSVSVSNLSSGRGLQRTNSTNDEGNFKIGDLPAGVYNITAIVPGFVNSQSGRLDALCRLGDNVTVTMMKGGVITGKVLDAAGQPLVGAPVWALRVRDAEGRPAVDEAAVTPRPAMSDDRGVYRLYGLLSGAYVVYSGGAGEALSTSIGAREVPTYYPSATRDTAQEIFVSAGSEIQDIDIRHRGELGYAISGKVIGAFETSPTMTPNVKVELLRLEVGTLIAVTNVNLRSGNSFGVYGIPDGEYEIVAQQSAGNFDGRNDEASSSASAPRRVTVRGGDVTGLELQMVPLSSISGRVVLEKLDKTDCQITRRGKLEELLILPYPEDQKIRRSTFGYLSSAATPDDKGEFIIRDLEAGRYWLHPQLPSDHWYIKTISLAGTTPAKVTTARTTTTNLTASGLTLKSGEKLTGLALTMAEGAAEVTGYVEGKKLPTRLRVYLVPVEAASDVLRYAEVTTQDGSFSLKHLVPGKYWLLARAVPSDESNEKPAKPTAWNADARLKLRHDAAAANQVLELTPCQRAKDFVLRF